MTYLARGGEALSVPLGDWSPEQMGLYYVQSGSLSQSLRQSPVSIQLKSGALISINPEAHSKLQMQVTETLELRYWNAAGFELVTGQELELAISSLISLSNQQRQLNGFLPENEPISHLPESETQQGHFEVSSEAPAFGMQTQQGLFQLAFHGVGGVSMDILTRFGKLYRKGEALCRIGEMGHELFLILKGEVKVSIAEREVGRLQEGDIVGEMAVLEGQKRSATVTALDDVQVLALGREHFQMIFQLHPSWTWQLLNGFIGRIDMAWKRLESLY